MRTKKNTVIQSQLNNFIEWDNKRYKERADKESIFPIGITDREFVEIVSDLFLGSDWYTPNPLSHEQVNEEILKNILWKFIK